MTGSARSGFTGEALRSVLMSNAALAVAYVAQLFYALHFGAGKELDIYFATNAVANGLLNLIGVTLIIGVAGHLMEKHAPEQSEIGWGFVAAAFTAIASIAALTLLAAAPLLNWLIPAHMATDPELAVNLLQANIVAATINAFATAASALLYARGAVGVAGISPVFVSLGGILGLAFAPGLGVLAIALGTLGGAFARAAAVGLFLLTRLKYRLSVSVSGVRSGAALYFSLGPLVLAGIPMLAASVLDKWFLSLEPLGSISVLTYGLLLNVTFAGLIGGGLLPVAARAAKRGDFSASSEEVILRFTKKALIVSLPLVACFILLRQPIADMLLGYGNMDMVALQQIAQVMLFSAGILAASSLSVLTGGFISKKRPIVYAGHVAVGFLAFISLAAFLTPKLGILGVAVAYSGFYLTPPLTMGLSLLGRALREQIWPATRSAALLIAQLTACVSGAAWISSLLPELASRSLDDIMQIIVVFAIVLGAFGLLRRKDLRQYLDDLKGTPSVQPEESFLKER